MQNVHNSIYITYDSKSSFFRFSKVLKSTRTKNFSTILNVQFICRKLRASIKSQGLPCLWVLFPLLRQQRRTEDIFGYQILLDYNGIKTRIPWRQKQKERYYWRPLASFHVPRWFTILLCPYKFLWNEGRSLWRASLDVKKIQSSVVGEK